MQKKGQEELKRNKKGGQLGQDKTGAAHMSHWHPASAHHTQLVLVERPRRSSWFVEENEYMGF